MKGNIRSMRMGRKSLCGTVPVDRAPPTCLEGERENVDAYNRPVPSSEQKRCPECGFSWTTGVEDAIAMVAESPHLFAQAFSVVDPVTPVRADAWSPNEYLWHMVDVLRIGTERLWALHLDPGTGVPSWDENDLARVRRYGELSPTVGVMAYGRAAQEWVNAAGDAPPQARTAHSESGTISAEEVIRRNAHEAQHHLLDIEQAAPRRSGNVFIARSPEAPHAAPARSDVPSRLFDDFVMVDWSASSHPRTGKDSIWIASGAWYDDTFKVGEPTNPPTRHAAMDEINHMIEQSLDAGRRTVIGFDFPFSYPAGTSTLAPAVFGRGPAWRAIWRTLTERVQDEPDNKNNRWAVAESLNRDTGCRLFWGCPANHANNYLGARDKELPGLAERGPRPDRLRLTERRARGIGGSIQSVWKLAYAGSVGSQALLGIPYLERMRSRYGDRLSVWPFETDVTRGVPAETTGVTLVEIWPTIFPTDFGRHPVRDAAQVLQVLESCARADRDGTIVEWLAPAVGADMHEQLAEEGWILGVT